MTYTYSSRIHDADDVITDTGPLHTGDTDLGSNASWPGSVDGIPFETAVFILASPTVARHSLRLGKAHVPIMIGKGGN